MLKSLVCFSLIPAAFLLFCFLFSHLLHWHSSTVYHGFSSWNSSPTKFPGACLFFSSFLFFPLLNTILLVFNQINKGKWFSQYSSLSWTWCFIQSFTFLSLLYFPLRSTHRKYNPFKLICWMCASWEKGFLGNTKYGTLLCLSAHQLVDWQLFPCRNNLFQNGICIVNSTMYRK